MRTSDTIKRRNDTFLSFYFFFMYLYTSMPTMQMSMIENSNVFFLLIGYGLTIASAFKYRVNFFKKRLFWVLCIVAVWTATQFVVNRSYFKFSPFTILEIIAAYTIIRIYKEEVYKRFEDVTFILSVIAIFGWVISLLVKPVLINYSIGIEGSPDRSRSLIIYTYNIAENLRNCGFAWEPGRTACMVSIGILFNLMRTSYDLKSRRFWIMTICLLTTLSTTGFAIMMVILILCYFSFRKFNPIIIAALISVSIGVLSLPFMWDKISELKDQATEEGMIEISNSLNWKVANENNEQRSYYIPQRFQGLMFSVINLQNTNIYIGDGRDFTQFYINRIFDWKVKTSEGILEPVIRYGVIIAFLMYYYLFCSSKRISSFFGVKNKWIFFIIFVMINISYNFWETPLFMAIWMMPIFLRTKKSIKNKSKHKYLQISFAKG